MVLSVMVMVVVLVLWLLVMVVIEGVVAVELVWCGRHVG